MKRERTLKQRFADGGRAFGSFFNSGSPVLAELMALAGYDCLMIDREHGAGDLTDALAMIHAIETTPCAALMRIPGNDAVELKRVLDLGVEGVMVPAVNSAAEAQAVAAACRYPPEGVRGMAIGIVRASDYGFRTAEYAAAANRNHLVICQIETGQAVDQIEAIAEVDGIDMLFIGPYDLSASLGRLGEPDHPSVTSRIAHVEAATRRAGKWLGGIVTPGRDATRLFADGYRLVLGSADLLLLRDAAQAHAAAGCAAARG